MSSICSTRSTKSGTEPGSACSPRNLGHAAASSSVFLRSFERGRMRNHNRDENQMSHSDRKSRTATKGLARLLAPASAAVVLLATSTAALAQSDAPNPLLPRNLSPWGMFMNADVVVKAVMIGLAFASLVTWTIWLAKTIELRLAARSVRRRLKMLESGPQLSEAVRACDGARDAVAQLVLSTAREAELSDFIVDDGLKERVALR